MSTLRMYTFRASEGISAELPEAALDAAQAMVEAVAHKFGIIEVPSKVYLSENEKGEFDFAFVFLQEDLKPAN